MIQVDLYFIPKKNIAIRSKLFVNQTHAYGIHEGHQQ